MVHSSLSPSFEFLASCGADATCPYALNPNHPNAILGCCPCPYPSCEFVNGIFTSIVESYLRRKPQEYASFFKFPLTGPEEASYCDPKVAGGGQGMLHVTHAMGMVMRFTELRATQVFTFMENFDLDVDLADAFSYRLDNGAIGTMRSTGAVRPNSRPIRDSSTSERRASSDRT